VGFQRYIRIAVIVIAASGVSLGQTPDAARQGEADRARLDQPRAQGHGALYNLEYEGARRGLREAYRKPYQASGEK